MPEQKLSNNFRLIKNKGRVWNFSDNKNGKVIRNIKIPHVFVVSISIITRQSESRREKKETGKNTTNKYNYFIGLNSFHFY